MIVEKLVEGVLVDPVLPEGFWSTPLGKRPASHLAYWERPFVLTVASLTPPRFDVFCLDGGAWERPTCWGRFRTLEEALRCAGAANGLPLDKFDRFGPEGGWKTPESRAFRITDHPRRPVL